MDRNASDALRNTIKASDKAVKEANGVLEQSQFKLSVAQADSVAARETFNNWLATRRTTQQADQDAELIARTKALDALKDKERAAGVTVEAQQQVILNAQQASERARSFLSEQEQTAQQKLNSESRRLELRVFLYRLALTLPLLVVAGWLFVKKRKGTYWPFVWGFIFFALLWRLRALCGGHHRHRADRASGHCVAEPLPGKTKTGRTTA
jgi:hypothetical protein